MAELGERYRVAGDAAGLAAAEKKLADMKADRPAALLVLGRLLHAEEKDVEAVSVLEQALALKPDDFETESELGLVYKALGQYWKAARVMEKALKKRPQENMLTVEVGICYVRMGRLERAKAAFARAKRINGKAYYKAYIAQGYAYLDAGHDAQARREFESLIAVDTASPFGYHHMGVFLFRQHNYHEAEEYLRSALQRLEANPSSDSVDLDHALDWLGATLRRQGKLAEAEAVYRKGLEKTRPGPYWRAILLDSLGSISEDEGKPAKAEGFFKQALAACEPGRGCSRLDWANAALKLGALYAAQGRKPEAEALADRIGKLCDDHPVDEVTIEPVLKLGDLYAELGQSSKAEALLRRIFAARGALPANPAMAEAEAALADIYKKQGRLAEAENLYLKAIEAFKIQGKNVEVIDALNGLAAAYEREGKGSAAAAARRQAEALRAQGGKS